MVNIDRSQKILGHYALIRLIGRGGFADVWLARHIHLGTLHAVKILKTSLVRNGRRKFLEEARLLAALENEHIVRIQDYGVQNGIPYLVMSYAPNGTLRDRYPRGTQLSFDTTAHYLEQIAEALDYLHAQNLIHLDVKPDNLLLGRNDEVLLGDFGITEAAHSASGSRSGTISHMSPEHLRAAPCAASDQYALAVCAHEWLTGQLPFRGTRAEVKWKHLHERPGSLRALASDIPPAMDKVVRRALSKNPQERYPSVGAFVAAFKQAIPSAPPPARTWPLRDYWMKIETWEEMSKFFVSKVFISTILGIAAYLPGQHINLALIAFGGSLPLVPLPGVFRKSNRLAQVIALVAFFISILIGVALHSLQAFAIAQVIVLALGKWITLCRKWLLSRG
jgi:serine/threonine protein kinase